MKRLRFLSLLTAFLALIAVAVLPVSAADEYDISLNGNGQNGWSPLAGDCSITYNGDSDRFDSCFGWDGGFNTRSMVTKDFTGRRITRIRVEFEFQQTRTQGSALGVWNRILVGTVIPPSQSGVLGGANYAGQVGSYAVPGGLVTDTGVMDTGAINISGDLVTVVVGVRSESFDVGYARITQIEVWTSDPLPGAGAGWTRPLAQTDEHGQWEMFDWTYVNSLDSEFDLPSDNVFAFSETFGAPVYAALDATVLSVLPFTTDQCQNLNGNYLGLGIAYTFGQHCYVVIPKPINDDFENYVFRINPVGLYRVDLKVGQDQILSYIVTDAPDYVTAGDTIQQGCILGLTSQLLNITNIEIDSIQFNFNQVLGGTFGVDVEWRSLVTQYGMVSMAFGQQPDPPTQPFETLRIFPSLDTYAQFDEACNANPEYSQCLGDPLLAHPSEWMTTGDVAWLDPGVQLQPGANIRMQMNLADSTAYSLTAVAARTGVRAGSIRLQIGNTIETSSMPAAPNQLDSYTIAPGLHTPDIASFYTVSVTNTGSEFVEISSFCLTEGAANTAPTSCYFSNFSFDFGSSAWTVSSGVTAGEGALYVPNGETFSQNLHLFPDDLTPHDYTLRIETQLWVNNFFNPNDPLGSSGTVDLTYDWDTTTGAPIGSSTTFNQFRANGNRYTSTETITVSAETNDPIVFHVGLSTSDTDVLGLSILSVCIAPPFFDDNPNQGGPGFELQEECQIITPPVGNNIGDWISWQWAKLNRFFTCDLMVLLNRLFRLVNDAVTTLKWSIRYWITVARLGVDWLANDLLPYMAGYWSNAAGGTTTINNGAGEACEWWNLLCHLIKGLDIIADVLETIITELISPLVNFVLWLVQRVFDLLTVALVGLLSLGFILIAQLLGFIGLGLDLVGLLVNSWNTATPAAISGLPNCTGAATGDFWCSALWTLEHTLFSGSGALLIPLITSIGTIHLMIWVVRKLQTAFTSAVQAV